MLFTIFGGFLHVRPVKRVCFTSFFLVGHLGCLLVDELFQIVLIALCWTEGWELGALSRLSRTASLATDCGYHAYVMLRKFSPISCFFCLIWKGVEVCQMHVLNLWRWASTPSCIWSSQALASTLLITAPLIHLWSTAQASIDSTPVALAWVIAALSGDDSSSPLSAWLSYLTGTFSFIHLAIFATPHSLLNTRSPGPVPGPLLLGGSPLLVTSDIFLCWWLPGFPLTLMFYHLFTFTWLY